MTETPDFHFDLTTQPWIAAINAEGRAVDLSLIELFRKASDLREITDPNPLTVGALLRLSLAILHRALKGPRDLRQWAELWNQGDFESCGVVEYLENWRDHFDLFSPTTPFYQTANFTLDNAVASHKLTHDLATGNNKTLFDHSLDEQPLPMTPAQAARGLVTTQLYALGGGQGPTSNLFKQKHPNFAHAPLVLGALVFLRGDNLFQTLMLNLLRYDADRNPIACVGEDRPIWERRDLTTPGLKPVTGYLEYLTWRSRHIRLLPEQVGGQIRVRRLYMAQAETFAADFQDPMFVYFTKKDGTRGALKLRADRALWRDSASLLEFSADEKDGPRARRPAAIGQLAELLRQRKVREERYYRCYVIGLVNDKANPLLWRMENMTVPASLLEDKQQVGILAVALQRAETVSERLSYCTRALAEALLTLNRRSPDKKELEKLERTLGTMPDYWAALEPLFVSKILNAPSEQALRDWTETLFKTARLVLEQSAGNYLASSARDLQAHAKGMACLNASLKKLRHEYYPEPETETAP